MKIDSKGNLIIGTTAILIVALLLICIFVISCINYIQNENIDSVQNDNFKYLIDDYTQNLEISQRDAIAKATQKIFNGLHIFNSENQIKKNLNEILDEKNKEYEEKYGVKITSEVLSVENTDSAWKILFKTRLNVQKDNEKFSKIIEKNATIEGLRDPLPLAKLTIASGILTYDDKIHYQEGLSAYMLLHQFDSPESYIEATAPLYIKKCPYDPYIHHGDPGVLDDCLKQGYFHESADGSCYLCRLEGKGKCPHYGFEVFIQTHTPLKNESLSCSDHVVFADHYNGQKIDPDDWNSLILDSSHQKKYGLDKNDR
ncbi:MULTISPECIES: hypothetical protein [Methanobrevibacter]|uniref:hypothetical protein n=1 Tax=Methanobrevibacter TaxID=2172 RepID=UPI0025D6A655|nr:MULTISPECIES: hypothetical protein [Methanobrevibacter]MBS7257957.1 hypothetical protein [Methanobrevibacter sp.]MCI7429033.1 hypothetical protein [Methanobrevibacter sp.]MDD6776997.1 hypothetical protein [Methanobacteriaceae archaeon]MDY3097067.1 hypothetical protein [Methanobrevibacter sp.]